MVVVVVLALGHFEELGVGRPFATPFCVVSGCRGVLWDAMRGTLLQSGGIRSLVHFCMSLLW